MITMSSLFDIQRNDDSYWDDLMRDRPKQVYSKVVPLTELLHIYSSMEAGRSE